MTTLAATADRYATIIRLPNPRNVTPVAAIADALLAAGDLGLADELHVGSETRPFACVRRLGTIDVVAFRDDLAVALKRGNAGARLVTRVNLTALAEPDEELPSIHLRIAYCTPTHLRVAGMVHLLPDPVRIFRQLDARWQALDLPPLPAFDPTRLATEPEQWLRGPWWIQGDEVHPGWQGVVHYDLRSERERNPAGCRTLWTLARFAELRGIGGHTSYGMGRVRIWDRDRRWSADAGPCSVWEPLPDGSKTGSKTPGQRGTAGAPITPARRAAAV